MALPAMAIPLMASAGISGAGSIIGSLIGQESEKDALKFQKNMGQKSLLEQSQASRLAGMAQEPYQNLGMSAAPLLQYLVTGTMPQGQGLTDEDLSLLDQLSGQENAMLDRRAQLSSSTTGSRSNQRRYAAEMQQIDSKLAQLAELEQRRAMNNALAGVQGEGGFQQSPLYDWQQEQGTRALNRAAASKGLSNSTAALNALGNFNQQLGAEERNRQVGDLMNLVNIGRGAATQVGNINMSGANALTNMQQGIGGNIAAGTREVGRQQGSMWSNLGALPMNALSLGIQGGMFPGSGGGWSPSQGQNLGFMTRG